MKIDHPIPGSERTAQCRGRRRSNRQQFDP